MAARPEQYVDDYTPEYAKRHGKLENVERKANILEQMENFISCLYLRTNMFVMWRFFGNLSICTGHQGCYGYMEK